jgi:hypothetical protein
MTKRPRFDEAFMTASPRRCAGMATDERSRKGSCGIQSAQERISRPWPNARNTMNSAAEFLPATAHLGPALSPVSLRGHDAVARSPPTGLAFIRARLRHARMNGAACVTRTRDPRITKADIRRLANALAFATNPAIAIFGGFGGAYLCRERATHGPERNMQTATALQPVSVKAAIRRSAP